MFLLCVLYIALIMYVVSFTDDRFMWVKILYLLYFVFAVFKDAGTGKWEGQTEKRSGAVDEIHRSNH